MIKDMFHIYFLTRKIKRVVGFSLICFILIFMIGGCIKYSAKIRKGESNTKSETKSNSSPASSRKEVEQKKGSNEEKRDGKKKVQKGEDGKMKEVKEKEHPIAFNYLPHTETGDVNWVAAITNGYIKPRDGIWTQNQSKPPFDLNIIFEVKKDLPDVEFSHYSHTLWLDCINCHPSIVSLRTGVDPISMKKINEGEFCGSCHGKVAFSLNECERCHSKVR